MQYDSNITLQKGLKSFGLGLAAVVGAAVFGYFTDAKLVSDALHGAGASDLLVIAAVPVLKALGTMGLNWLKNHNQ